MEIKEMKIIKDGDSWCFILPDFEDLQNSPAIFTQQSVTNYLDSIYKSLKNNIIPKELTESLLDIGFKRMQ